MEGISWCWGGVRRLPALKQKKKGGLMRRKKLNELLFARVLSSSEQPPTWPRNNFSQEHYFKANWSHPWNVASFRNSTTHCKLPSPAGSSTKSPVPLFLFTSSLLFSFANFLHLFFFLFPETQERKVKLLNPFCRTILKLGILKGTRLRAVTGKVF